MRDYRTARQWLVGAGVLPDGRIASGRTEGAGESQAQQPAKGKVAGPLEWPGVNSQFPGPAPK